MILYISIYPLHTLATRKNVAFRILEDGPLSYRYEHLINYKGGN